MKEANTKDLFIIIILFIAGIFLISGCIPNQQLFNQNYSNMNQNMNSEESSDLPIYPGSHKSDRYNEFAKIVKFSEKFPHFKVYSIEGASPDDVIKWYKSQFSDYDIDMETANFAGKPLTSIVARNGNTYIGIVVFSDEGKTIYFIGRMVVEEYGLKLPSHDLVSGDEPIERYPGSIMLEYKKFEGPAYDITYGTRDNIEKVASWFKTTLSSQGWELDYEYVDEEIIELSFKRGSDKLFVWIGPPPEGNRYTEIAISYN